MSKKIYYYLGAGLMIGAAVPVLLKFLREQELFSGEDLSEDEYDYEPQENAGIYFNRAKKKADDMVKDAEARSSSILEDAAKILAKAKQKTSEIHYDVKDTAEAEINKLREEIGNSIETFKKKLDE